MWQFLQAGLKFLVKAIHSGLIKQQRACKTICCEISARKEELALLPQDVIEFREVKGLQAEMIIAEVSFFFFPVTMLLFSSLHFTNRQMQR